jgi:hypothetical protein
MPQLRWMYAGLCLLALAAPAVSQRGQYDDRSDWADRGARDGVYDRDARGDRDRPGDRDDRRYDRDDRTGDRDRDRDGRWSGGRRGADQPLPGGSWVQSCRRSGMSGNTLSAQCKDQRGKWRDTQINPRSCQTGRVGNRFGTLSCE